MDQLYNYMKQLMADVRSEIEHQIHNDNVAKELQYNKDVLSGKNPKKPKLETVCVKSHHLGQIISKSRSAFDVPRLNHAAMECGNVPPTRAALSKTTKLRPADDSQDFKNFIARNKDANKALNDAGIHSRTFAQEAAWDYHEVQAVVRSNRAPCVQKRYSSTGRIWQWAGARALTDPFVINGMREEQLRKVQKEEAKTAEQTRNRDIRSQQKKVRQDAELIALRQKASKAWSSATDPHRNMESFLTHLSIRALRAICRFTHFALNRERDSKQLLLHRGTSQDAVRLAHVPQARAQ